uniref:Uncharacterized protein n=1 Tax=Ditylenchus dipsaci TaxID=166011 RepID=A0A915DEQ6_9BILA
MATSTAGAMIPMEISKIQRYTKAAFLLKTQSGFYAKPTDEHFDAIKSELVEKLHLPLKEVTNEDVYKEFVRRRIKLAMTLGKTSSFATSSMGIGSFLGFITWLPVFSLAKIGFVNEAWQRIISIMTNTPTEIYSFTLGTLTANIMRNKTFSSWWASDAVKSERMIELIFKKAIKQMETEGEPLEEITDKEIYEIYITKLSAYGYGAGVVKVINFVIEGILEGVKTLKKKLGFQVPPGLLEGVDIAKIMGPETANEKSEIGKG